jgi:hypothetical protein
MSELNKLKKELDALRVEAVMLRCRVEDTLDKIKEFQESTGKEVANE